MALAWEPCLATMLIKHCDRCTYRYTGTETVLLASSTLLPLALALACMPIVNQRALRTVRGSLLILPFFCTSCSWSNLLKTNAYCYQTSDSLSQKLKKGLLQVAGDLAMADRCNAKRDRCANACACAHTHRPIRARSHACRQHV
jgi:hypothetical protein